MAAPIVETRIAWPGGAHRAIMLSFDFNAWAAQEGKSP